MNEILKEDLYQIINENDGLKDIYGKSFLITGASGMIGSYFANTLYLLNEEYNADIKINLLVRDPEKLPEYLKNNKNVNIIVQDVTLPINCEGKVDYLVHAASPASPLIMKEHPVETNFANTIGTANTLNLAKDKKSEGYLFISSREIYGEPRENQEYFYETGPYGDVDQLVPRNGYAEGKKAAENMCVSFKQEYGLNTKIVRLAHTYGPGMSIYDGRVQADFLKNIINDEDIVLKSEGKPIRTYTYISDAISAMFMILLKSKDVVYNISSMNSVTSIRELAETLVKLSDKNLKLVFDIPKENTNTGTSSFMRGILSSEKLTNELGWTPKYNIEEGFKRTIKYLRKSK